MKKSGQKKYCSTGEGEFEENILKADHVNREFHYTIPEQHMMGNAIVGELAGTELKVIPSLVVSVEKFFKRFPD